MTIQVPVNPPANVATDEIAGVHHQFAKLEFGANGSATPVSLANPLPVQTEGLTDSELRATPLPVSGPLTDAQLRATALPVSLSSAPLATGAATAANQAAGNTAIAQVGTRRYGAAPTRMTLTTSSQTSPQIAATEVMLYAPGTNTGRVYVNEGASASLNDKGLEPGETFHMRIANNATISALLDSGAGFLNIKPVTA